MINQKNQLMIGLAIGAVLGLAVGMAIGAPGTPDQSAQVQKLQAQIEQAKKFFPPAPQDIQSISGTVKSIAGNVITMETGTANPFDEAPRTRTITTGDQTKITRNEQKDAARFQKEVTAFQKAMQSGTNTPIPPPSPFRDVAAHLSDIKPGQQIVVTAAQNIRDMESFNAISVSILSASGFTPVSNKP